LIKFSQEVINNNTGSGVMIKFPCLHTIKKLRKNRTYFIQICIIEKYKIKYTNVELYRKEREKKSNSIQPEKTTFACFNERSQGKNRINTHRKFRILHSGYNTLQCLPEIVLI